MFLFKAPLSSLILALIVPFFEPVFRLPFEITASALVGDPSAIAIAVCLTTGFCATIWNHSVHGEFINILDNREDVSTNVSYCVMDHTLHICLFLDYSTRYNMIGHCKFCVTLMGGYLLFHDPLSANQLFGVLLTFGGIIIYTYLKLEQQKQSKQCSSKLYTKV